MSYTLKKINERVTATFTKDQKEGEIASAFLEIIDTIHIEEIKCIIFDCSKALNYTATVDYITRVKTYTQFSITWNSNISIIFIAKNKEIRDMVTDIINHCNGLKWKYYLFENISDANSLCDENTVI